MPRVLVEPLWQQKHPTPSHTAWDFHFHPKTVPAALTDALASLDVAMAGAGVSAFLVGPDLVCWVRTFTATVASEQRQYTGLAGVVARPGGERDWGEELPAVLEALTLPPAAPYGMAGTPPTGRTLDLVPTPPMRPIAPWAPLLPPVEAKALAAAVVAGGPVGVSEPGDERLPALFGRALSWLPPSARTVPRRGGFVRLGAKLPTLSPGHKSLLHYLSASLAPPEDLVRRDPGFPTAVWRLVHDLCAALRVPPETLFAELSRVGEVWEKAADLARYLEKACPPLAGSLAVPAPLAVGDDDAGVLWTRVLHYWGRGLVPDDLGDKLATVLAYRVLVDHLVHLDEPRAPELPRRYLRRLRYETLLTRDRAQSMLATLRGRLPSLFAERA